MYWFYARRGAGRPARRIHLYRKLATVEKLLSRLFERVLYTSETASTLHAPDDRRGQITAHVVERPVGVGVRGLWRSRCAVRSLQAGPADAVEVGRRGSYGCDETLARKLAVIRVYESQVG